MSVTRPVWSLPVAVLVPALVLASAGPARAQELPPSPAIQPAQAARMIALPRGLQASVWAAEPLLENPVAFAFDEQGRVYVTETNRIRSERAVLDNRRRDSWPSAEFRRTAAPARLAGIAEELLDAELANRTLADREAMLRRYFVGDLDRFRQDSERIKLISDTNGDGKADDSRVYAEGFNGLLDGVAAGVLSRHGQVWLTSIPSLWSLRDRDGDGAADERKELSRGYGLRYAFIGHDLHGLRIGPDGKLYFSIGDRGAHVATGGRTLAVPDTGAVFRCNLDGSDLEIFATGLRNPQELAFDSHGNLFTGDNNSDGGDKARLVQVVEGGDSGWRVGYQYLEAPRARGPWNAERLWHAPWPGQARYLVPPVGHIGNGPSGLTFHPGTGAPSKLKDHLFLADFRGQASISGVHAVAVKPRGAGFEIAKRSRFAWGVLATDVEFGPDGALYLLDWVSGWTPTGHGRIYRVTEAGTSAAQVKLKGISELPEAELVVLLGHADMRVRLEAQFALVEKKAHVALQQMAAGPADKVTRLARLHAVWGLGQLIRPPGVDVVASEVQGRAAGRPAPLTDVPAGTVRALVALLGDRDAEVRAQAAKVLGEGRRIEAFDDLVARVVRDPSPRVRFFAALALGKVGRTQAVPALLAMLRQNADRDPYLRHAGIMGLTLIGDRPALLAHAADRSAAARAGVLLALRRLESLEVRRFLRDLDPAVVREAARAINDVPLEGAVADLAALVDDRRAVADPVVLPRIINANYRVGTRQAAQALVTLAVASGPAGKRGRGASEQGRRDALLALASWSPPPSRDRVTGLWHPVPTASRDALAARDLLGPAIRPLLAAQPGHILEAAITAAAALKLGEAAPGLFSLVASRTATPEVRLQALRALAALSAPELSQALAQASSDPALPVRLEALALKVKLDPARALDVARATLARGSVREKQLAVRIVADTAGPAADDVLARLAADLTAGALPPELTLDVLEAAARRKPAPAVAAAVARFEAQRPKDDLGPYREALAGGDFAAGVAIFWNRADVACSRCHSFEREGTGVGPSLVGIGRRSREYLLEAVVHPSKHFATGYQSVLVTLKNGTTHGGTLVRETGTRLTLRSPDGVPMTVDKADIKSREPGVSGMPEGFGQILSKRDLRNLVEFLATMRGRS